MKGQIESISSKYEYAGTTSSPVHRSLRATMHSVT